MVLLWQGLHYALEDVEQYPWLPPTGCHSTPPPRCCQPEMSPDAQSPLGPNCPWWRTAALRKVESGLVTPVMPRHPGVGGDLPLQEWRAQWGSWGPPGPHFMHLEGEQQVCVPTCVLGAQQEWDHGAQGCLGWTSTDKIYTVFPRYWVYAPMCGVWESSCFTVSPILGVPHMSIQEAAYDFSLHSLLFLN